MVSFKTLAAAVLLFATAATPALAQGRALYIKNLRDSGYNPKDDFNPNETSRLQGYRIEGREIAAPPWSFACMNDQGPQQCDEPMWVYGSPDYLAQFKNAF
jgi:hypothetical protein